MNSVDAPPAAAIHLRLRFERATAEGKIQVEKAAPSTHHPEHIEGSRLDAKETKTPRRGRQTVTPIEEAIPIPTSPRFEPIRGVMQTVKIYPYGVARNRLMQAAKRLGVPVIVGERTHRG